MEELHMAKRGVVTASVWRVSVDNIVNN